MRSLLVVVLTFCSLFVLSFAHAQKKKDRDAKPAVALENRLDLCQDGVDNDGDNHVDCDDQDCEVFVACLKQAEGGEETASAAADTGEEVAVDLDALEEEESPAAAGHDHGGSGHPGGDAHVGNSPKMPKLKLFFDLLIEYEWETSLFQFTRDHAHVMLELTATDWLTFRADIAFEPELFEGIFQLGKVGELRLGKILVPFGQNEFHHLIGGRVDQDALFLPTVWGEYGAAFRHFVYGGEVVDFNYALWVINGFQDIKDRDGNPILPASSDGSLRDNNQMKGVGLRPTLGIGRSVILGTSWYLDAWDPKNENWMLIYGVDVELGYNLIPVKVLRDFRLRAEFAWAEVKLPTGQNAYHGIFAGEGFGILPNYGIRRSGYNLELSYRPIKILTIRYREGWLNDDSRVVNQNDLLVHEPGVLVTLGPVQFSLVVQLLQRRYDNWQERLTESLETAGKSPAEIATILKNLEEDMEYSRILFRVLYRY